jgi:hypothetical protein
MDSKCTSTAEFNISNAYNNATRRTTKLQRHIRLVLFRSFVSPPDISAPQKIAYWDSMVILINRILKIIDSVGYRRVISSFIDPRIPQNRRGEMSGGNMRIKHKINVRMVHFVTVHGPGCRLTLLVPVITAFVRR